MEDEVLDIVEESKENSGAKKEKSVTKSNESEITNVIQTNITKEDTLPVNQNSVAIDNTISEIVSTTTNYIENEDKKLSKSKKIAIVILSILLLIDIAALVIYIIGFDKVFTFIK